MINSLLYNILGTDYVDCMDYVDYTDFTDFMAV